MNREKKIVEQLPTPLIWGRFDGTQGPMPPAFSIDPIADRVNGLTRRLNDPTTAPPRNRTYSKTAQAEST